MTIVAINFFIIFVLGYVALLYSEKLIQFILFGDQKADVRLHIILFPSNWKNYGCWRKKGR